MTTTADLIARTQRHLFTGSREEMNRLANNYTAGGTTLSFSYDLGGIQPGASVAIGLELFYVFAVDQAGMGATVIGAQGGSTAANHTAGDVVIVNPKFSPFDIFLALNDDINDLSSALFQIKELDFTYNPAVQGYDMTGVTSVLGIQEIRFEPRDASKSWPRITNFAFVRNQNPSEFASTFQLILYEPAEPGGTFRVQYRAPFTTLSTLTDDVFSVSGLAPSAHDIPPLGAAARLVAGREVKRNFTEAQGETRRATEVPPGAVNASSRSLLLLRAQRIMAEAANLAGDYPVSYRHVC